MGEASLPSGQPTGKAGSSSSFPPDRRHFPRFLVAGSSSADCIEGVLSVFGWGKKRRVKAILDVSLGGARLRLEDRLEPGTVIRVRLVVGEPSEELEAYGETRWSSPCAEGAPDFQSGIMFFNVSETVSRQLSVLQNRLSSSSTR